MVSEDPDKQSPFSAKQEDNPNVNSWPPYWENG